MKTTLILSIMSLFAFAGPVGDPVAVNFSELSNYDYEEGMELPEAATKYHEKTIQVSGFMASEDGTEDETPYFVLINDACGCEGSPKLNEIIFCAMPEGEVTKIKPGTVTVTGKFYAQEEIEEGVVISLYTLAVDSIK